VVGEVRAGNKPDGELFGRLYNTAPGFPAATTLTLTMQWLGGCQLGSIWMGAFGRPGEWAQAESWSPVTGGGITATGGQALVQWTAKNKDTPTVPAPPLPPGAYSATFYNPTVTGGPRIELSVGATDDGRCGGSSGSLGVLKMPPVAEFTPSVSQTVPRQASFVNTSTNGLGGLDGLWYIWNFGDGTTSTERNPMHVYAADGEYTVSLSVRNANALIATTTRVVKIGGSKLTAAIVDSPALTGNLKVGAEFDITARITNNADEPVTELALVDGTGIFGPDSLSVANGPVWSAPSTLSPGESVDVSWTLVSEAAGMTSVRVRATANLAGAEVEATADTRIAIAPPIDIKVDSGQTAAMVLGDEFNVAVTVTNEWDKPVEAVKPDGLNGPNFASIRVVAGPTGPGGASVPNGGYTLAPGESVRLDYRVRLDEQIYPAEITSFINGRDPESGAIFFLSGSSGSPDELEVQVNGLSPNGDVFDVEVTVRNTGDEPLDEVRFIDDAGLAYNPDVYEVEERGDLELISGATPPLPASLEPGQEVTTTFTAAAKDAGGVLLVSRVRGDLPNDTTLRAQDSVEVIIDSCRRTVADMKKCVVDLLTQQMELLNAQAVAGSLSFEDALANLFPEGVALPPTATQRSVGRYVPTLGEAALGLIPRTPDEAYQIAVRGIPAYYSKRLNATYEVLKGTVTAPVGIANGYIQNFVWVTPEVRNANVERVVDFALAEGGYQAEGIGSYLSVIEEAADGNFDEAQRQYIELLEQNERITGDLIRSAENYVDSQIDRFDNWKILATTDRVEATVQLLETKGQVEGTVSGLILETWLGARVTRAMEGAGLLKGSGVSDEVADLANAADPPPKPKRSTGDGPDAQLGEPDLPGSPKSLDRPNRLEDLTPGDVDSDMLSKLLNGHPPEVQAEFDRIIKELNDELDVDVVIEARSAEVEGIQKVLDGNALAKEQWNKAKSINFIDTTYLGVPSDLTGGAAFYRPKPDWAKINAIPREDPIRGLIEARIETQTSLWKKWSGETLDVNGNVVKVDAAPSGMRREFDQMLSQDGFEFSNTLRGQPARELDGTLVRDAAGDLVHDAPVVVQSRNVRLDMREVDLGEGRRAFIPLDRASGLPYGADVDILAVLDASKVPPVGFTGSQRSQIELVLQQKLRKSRIPFGEHGWTHAGFDLTDELSAVRIQELFRVRPPNEAAAAVAKFPASFGISSDLAGDELAQAIKKMQEKVSAGEYIITYGRNKKSIGYGTLPNVNLR